MHRAWLGLPSTVGHPKYVRTSTIFAKSEGLPLTCCTSGVDKSCNSFSTLLAYTKGCMELKCWYAEWLGVWS